jgi:TPR repeat protein
MDFFLVVAMVGKAALAVSPIILFFPGKARADDPKSSGLLRKAAESGNVEARYRLGWALENGVGFPQDLVEAMAWYQKADEGGHLLAGDKARALGESPAYQAIAAEAKADADFEKDISRVGDLAAFANYLPFIKNLEGLAIPEDVSALLERVRARDPLCMGVVAVYLLTPPQNAWSVPVALRWLRRAMAAGDKRSRNIYALMLLFPTARQFQSIPVDANPTEALRILREDAAEGFTDAMVSLLKAHRLSATLVGPEEAADWLEKAVLAGNRDAEYELAMELARPDGLFPQDPARSFRIVTRLADGGYKKAVKVLRNRPSTVKVNPRPKASPRRIR